MQNVNVVTCDLLLVAKWNLTEFTAIRYVIQRTGKCISPCLSADLFVK